MPTRLVHVVNIEVHAFGTVRSEIGAKVTQYSVPDQATVLDVLLRLSNDHSGVEDAVFSDDDLVRQDVVLLRNRKNIEQIEGLETLLEDGDVLYIGSSVEGG